MKNTLLSILIITLISCNKNSYKKYSGNAFGTTYHITINQTKDIDYYKTIDSIVEKVNLSLSTYQKNSIISKINNGDNSVTVDNKFKEVFTKSKRIYKETNGIFDPTIGVLINAWNFGPEKKLAKLDSTKIKTLMKQVGFDKVAIIHDKVVKKNPKTYLDFNAIAKGYGIDIIGRFLEQKNIKNYLIEIGGEIRAKGVNKNGTAWKIGIEKPNFDGSSSINKIVSINNESQATSGTYRKFKLDSLGNKYAHILNTKTGYPSKSNVLSASVIASLDCADVDGYATTLIAMGLEKSKAFLKKHPHLKGYLIYSDENGKLQTYQTGNLE